MPRPGASPRSCSFTTLIPCAASSTGNIPDEPGPSTPMTDAPKQSRRRDRSRAPRSMGPSLTPLPQLANPWPPLEILDLDQVERILSAAFQILEEAGLEIRSRAARDIYRSGGALVDEETQMVRIERNIAE